MMVIKLGIFFWGGDTVDENIMGTEPTIVWEYHRIQLPNSRTLECEEELDITD